MVETMITKSPVAMAIQTQLVNEHKKLVDTDAGAYVNEEMIRMEKKHKEDLEFLEEELKNTNNMSSPPHFSLHNSPLLFLLAQLIASSCSTPVD